MTAGDSTLPTAGDSAFRSGDDSALICQLCGSAAVDAAPTERILWVMERENGRQRWTCPACALAHVRSIEAKLQPEWW